MLRNLLMFFTVLAFSMILLTDSAWATCEQDLDGTWRVRVATTDESGRHCWEATTLQITRQGTIKKKGEYLDRYGEKSNITGGNLSLSSDCEIQGTIKTSNGTLIVETGAIVGDRRYLVLGVAQD